MIINNETCTSIGCTIRPYDCSYYKDEHLCSLQTTNCQYAKQLIDDKNELLEEFELVLYRMESEGIEYCFKHYSSFSEINDPIFHELRTRLILSMDAMSEYVKSKIIELRDE